jgi:hypothetical protein
VGREGRGLGVVHGREKSSLDCGAGGRLPAAWPGVRRTGEKIAGARVWRVRERRRRDSGERGLGMKTDWIRMDITHIEFVFIFLFGFGFGHE